MRVVVYLSLGLGELSARVYVYGDDGGLREEREFRGVKTVSIRAREVIVSRQLSPQPIALVVEAERPSVSFEGGVLRVVG